jgi:hypothetical protein
MRYRIEVLNMCCLAGWTGTTSSGRFRTPAPACVGSSATSAAAAGCAAGRA